MSKRIALLASALVALAAAASGGATAAVLAPCRGDALRGSFAAIPGSAGAGNIVYRLVLQNRSSGTCFVSGLPQVTLLGRTGRALPTHVVPALPGAGTAALVRLRPRARAQATARFSPDVPGPGEPVGATCEPVAYRLRVRAGGGGTVVAPIVRPTPVCEHGALQFSLYRRA